MIIVQDFLTEYRVPFFEQLRERLARDDIDLRLLYGRSPSAESTPIDGRSLSWTHEMRVLRPPLPRGRVATWQPVMQHARGADLVIVEHAAQHLVNVPLLAGQIANVGPRLAFWGHGANLQAAHGTGRVERAKNWAARHAHWWFAYTQGSADRVAATGFPVSRITVVNNTVAVAPLSQTPTRQDLTCVYVGAMYARKRIPYLLEAGGHLANLVPGFRLVVLGGGADRGRVEAAAKTAPWLDYRGATFGDDMASVIASSSLMLLPGAVGLAIVDGLAYGCPLVTTADAFHGPEVEYLRDGVNGVLLPATTTAQSYAESVAELLQDPHRLAALRAGCADSAAELSMTAMVERYATGVGEALSTPRAR